MASVGHTDQYICRSLVLDAIDFALATRNVGLARVLLEESSSLGSDWLLFARAYNISPLWAALVDGCAEVIMLVLEFLPDEWSRPFEFDHNDRWPHCYGHKTCPYRASEKYRPNFKYWHHLSAADLSAADNMVKAYHQGKSPLRAAFYLHGLTLTRRMLALGYRPYKGELAGAEAELIQAVRQVLHEPHKAKARRSNLCKNISPGPAPWLCPTTKFPARSKMLGTRSHYHDALTNCEDNSRSRAHPPGADNMHEFEFSFKKSPEV